MTVGAALYNFFSSFGIPAYPVSAVPDNAEMPYLTYDAPRGYFNDGDTSCVVNLWYKTESESIPSAKADEIGAEISYAGKIIPCDGGYIWLKRGSPWCQAIADTEDITIKRRYINITIEYLT